MKNLFILISAVLIAQMVHSADTIDLTIKNKLMIKKKDQWEKTELGEFSIAVDFNSETGNTISSLIDKIRNKDPKYVYHSPVGLSFICRTGSYYQALKKEDMSRKFATLKVFLKLEEEPYICLDWTLKENNSLNIKGARQNS